MICLGFLFFFSCELPQSLPANDYCAITRPIYWHADDTRRTKEQVDTHNRVWKVTCGGIK